MHAILPNSDMSQVLRDSFANAKRFNVAMALATSWGVRTIYGAVESCVKRGATGRFVFGTDLPSEPKAIRTLLRWAQVYPDRFHLRHCQPNAGIFHPKLYVFESHRGKLTAVVGSANLSRGGLQANSEASVLVEDQATCQLLDAFVDKGFDGADANIVE
jgi:HKD family nuclease